jgi:hypothetical protein
MQPDSNSLQDAGVLGPSEQQILISRQARTIKGFMVGIIVCIILFWLIAPIIIGIALFIVRQKQQAKLELLQQGSIRVSKTSGALTRKSALKQTFTYNVGGYLLPQIFNDGIAEKSNIRQYEGQVITVEVLPDLSLMRCYYDGSGTGYNFVSNSPLSPNAQ